MPTKLEQLLESYQGNAFPAMLQDEADHLGVTADSLRRLALGYAPVVEFKKGKNAMGWWVIPERDADGEPVGLSLRSQNDLKVMYPGSKHGLIYEVNPDHVRGDRGYEAGAHNWVRTMQAGIECPICHKPDGCLLSAENPDDPKAVICIRERLNAERPMRFGWLHIRRPDGRLNSRRALTDDGRPLLIVEGMSDTAAAMDLGFNAVGRPSNLACMDMLADLIRGYSGPVWVLGENDKKEDGREPGKEGAVAAFQTAKNVCHEVKWAMPPDTVKDLRAWKVKWKLTAEKLFEFFAEHGHSHTENAILGDSRPLTIARAYLDSQFRLAGRYTLKRWASTWYAYRDGRYAPLEDEAFEGPIYQWGHDKFVQHTTAKGATSLKPLEVNRTTVGNIAEAIGSETLIDSRRIPCWINGSSGPDPVDTIAFTNGILVVSEFLAGRERYLLDPTPDFFTMAAIPVPFDPTARCPEWKKFLKSSLGDDPDKIRLLQEWIGYCLTPDTSYQKMLFMRGPSGAGKGVVLNTLARLMGSEQTAATSFADLSGPFGLQPLIGKTVCLIGDARTPRSGDVMRGLELLLSIVGNDNLSVNRKHKEQLDLTRLLARISIASNEFLELPDHANALLRRLLILEFSHSFVGREDWKLEAKLKPETAGIVVWALDGLKRLRDRGAFTSPQSSFEAMNEWRMATNPLAAFIEECCELEEGAEVQKTELYDAWSAWSTERRIRPTTKSRFFERMRFAAPTIGSETYKKGVHKISIYRGIRLKAWAARKFIGKPV